MRHQLVRLWKSTRIDWTFARGRAARELRRGPGLSRAERDFIADALFGLIRNLRRIDAALEAGGLRRSGSAADVQNRVHLLPLMWSHPV